MGNLIRPYQRAITAIFPHQGNRRFLVPNRRKTADAQFTLVPGVSGVDVGFLLENFGALTPAEKWGHGVLLLSVNNAGLLRVGYQNGWQPVPGPIAMTNSATPGEVLLTWSGQFFTSAGNLDIHTAWTTEAGNPVAVGFSNRTGAP